MMSAAKRVFAVLVLGVAVALGGYMTTAVAAAHPVAAAKAAATSAGHCPASKPYCGHHKPPHHKQCKPYRHGHCKKPHCKPNKYNHWCNTKPHKVVKKHAATTAFALRSGPTDPTSGSPAGPNAPGDLLALLGVGLVASGIASVTVNRRRLRRAAEH